MPLVALGLVLTSAFLHAIWNAIVKAGDDRLVAAWATTAAGAILGLGLLGIAGLPSRYALAFALPSGVLHAAYVVALARAYDAGDLSLVYPIARGVAPVLATAGAVVAFHETLPWAAYGGIGLVTVGVLLLSALGHRADASVAREPVRQAIAWSLLTSACIAGYTLIDRQGVRQTSALSYVAVLFLIHSSLLALYVRAERRTFPWRLLVPAQMWTFGLSGALALGAYLLVLVALSISQVGYIAALRETSVLVAAWIGWRHLGDLQGLPRLVSSGVVALGLAILVASR